jgi:hypothetical protein
MSWSMPQKRRELLISAAVVIATGAFACGKTTTKPTPAPPSSSSASGSSSAVSGTSDVGELPLELAGGIYDPWTGTMFRHPGANETTWPPKEEGGWFRTPMSPSNIVLENDAVLRKDPTGKMTFWRRPLKGYVGGVRPPHAVVDEKHNRVIVTVDQHLVALDYTTGSEVWDAGASQNDGDRLTLDVEDELVFAITGGRILANGSRPNRRLVARKITDNGKELWSIELPPESDPNGIMRVTDASAPAAERLFVIVDRKFAWFFTPNGKVTIKLTDEELIYAAPIIYPSVPPSPGLIVMTSKRVAALDLIGNKRWELPAPNDTFVGGGGIVTVSAKDGDVLLYNFGRISDSGVELTRVRVLDGKVAYHVKAAPLGVAHSQYAHSAYVRTRDRHSMIDVVSIGSSGTFVESRNLADGKLAKRWQPNGKMVKPEPSTR